MRSFCVRQEARLVNNEESRMASDTRIRDYIIW